jgi:glycosyltransferase involved in cell wall biosynthesis
MAAARGIATRIRPDAVMVMSPPLPLGAAGWLVSLLRRTPFVFNIQDVFPDVAVELGAITDRRVIAAASSLERFLYRRADAVTVLSDDLRDNVAGKLAGRRPERIRVIPNFVDTVRITPAPRENGYRREYGLTGKSVVMYCRATTGGDPLPSAAALNELVILGPRDDSADAEALAEALGARWAGIGGPTTVPDALSRVLLS